MRTCGGAEEGKSLSKRFQRSQDAEPAANPPPSAALVGGRGLRTWTVSNRVDVTEGDQGTVRPMEGLQRGRCGPQVCDQQRRRREEESIGEAPGSMGRERGERREGGEGEGGTHHDDLGDGCVVVVDVGLSLDPKRLLFFSLTYLRLFYQRNGH